ncbi:sigma-70 family RNA polymerase sigma factor [Streptomyces litchfieldiae]|uniref:RNA polymerase sigma factor n=1 Tax=Streptomyces litchfieldiae TaxID=3075543 RepID=A0ABU2MQV1_9ACTN|nr:sigma-70 family RNA polymerase sigma factor [Streptomyces sp. DSM 44938]MDT0343782.1 sigma-70 family RNA polymerase sigma factor [Streptomyces sp. DSM 44938]
MTSFRPTVPGADPGARDDATVTAWALAARGGDRRAADLFVRAVQGELHRCLLRLSGDAQSAEDLVQETLLRALRSLPGFEGRSSARTWLLTIARRTVADRFRYERSRPRPADTADWLSAAESTPHGRAPGFEEGVALNDLLAALPADRGAAFALTQILGLPHAEAAAAIGCPIGTVRSRVARARRTLISQLAGAEAAGRHSRPRSRRAPA